MLEGGAAVVNGPAVTGFDPPCAVRGDSSVDWQGESVASMAIRVSTVSALTSLPKNTIIPRFFLRAEPCRASGYWAVGRLESGGFGPSFDKVTHERC